MNTGEEDDPLAKCPRPPKATNGKTVQGAVKPRRVGT